MADGPAQRVSTHPFVYDACDIPAGMTIREFRSLRALPAASPKRARKILRKILRILDPARQPDEVRRHRRG